MKIDWKLKGFNLLKFNCNKDQVVHPETCSDMVLMGHDGEVNLTDWIKGSTASIGNSLEDWITNNLSGSISIDTSWNPNTNLGTLDNNNSINLGYIAANTDNPVRVPYTTYSQIGLLGVNPNSTFTVSNGVLSLNPATSNYYGGIKTGFVNSGSKYAVQLDPNNKAYVDVPVTNTLSYYTPEDHGLTPFQDRPAGVCNDVEGGDWEDVDFEDLNSGEWYNKITSLLGSNSPTSSLDRIYPILADKYGRLYTYVNWTDTITTYSKLSDSSSASNSYVVQGSVPATRSKFLRGDGTWQDPYNELSSSAHSNTTTYVIKGPGTGAGWNTKFLKGDGTWAIPTDTTYNGDGKSVFLKSISLTSNTFYAPNQFSETTNIYGEASNSIDGYGFKKTNYNVIGIPDDVDKLIFDITNIFSYIANLSDDCSFELTYSYDYNDVLQWTLKGSEDDPFVLGCVDNRIECNIYGDIKATPSETPIISTSDIEFETGVPSKNTHTALTFIIVVKEGITYVDIISDNKEIQLSI